MDLDHKIIEELRELAERGRSPCELAVLIGQRLGLEGTNYRLQAIAYFREAFRLSMPDAMRIGAAPVFESEQRPALDVDHEIRPIIEATRSDWARSS